jgi:hypothetical protein
VEDLFPEVLVSDFVQAIAVFSERFLQADAREKAGK